MRALVSSLSIIALLAGPAAAQPGAQPQPYPPPQPHPPPQPYPAPYAPPPYGYAPAPLTAEEHALLAQGEISEGAHMGGAALALFVGAGIGQAVQGRWSDTGWIFTFGELAAGGLLIYGIVGISDDLADDATNRDDRDCHNCVSYIVVGALAISALRLWGTIDALAAPSSHNRRVREVRMKAGMPMYSLRPYVGPGRDGGGVAGVSLRF